MPFESLNHYSKGAVVSFLHQYVAGIRLIDDAPGLPRVPGRSRGPAAGSPRAQAAPRQPVRDDRVAGGV